MHALTRSPMYVVFLGTTTANRFLESKEMRWVTWRVTGSTDAPTHRHICTRLGPQSDKGGLQLAVEKWQSS